MELQEGTDVRLMSSQHLGWSQPSKRSTSEVIQKETDIKKCKQPTMSGSTGAIQQKVGHALGILVATFGRILVLLTRFTLPVTDGVMTQQVLDLVACLNFGTVADEHGGCAMSTDLILQGVDKFFVAFHALCSDVKRGCANKELGSLEPLSTAGTSE